MGDDARARQQFADALAFCEQRGLRPELAWTAYDFADFLLSSSRSEDRARSGDLLNQALALARQLGMRPLEARALELAQRQSSDRATRPTYPDGLTAREVEVMRLLAAGKTDRVIAEELTISIRTVGSHVSSILLKTTTANRTEVATYALRHSLA
jgi:DNA-binding NarL/FixJ family response regulator